MPNKEVASSQSPHAPRRRPRRLPRILLAVALIAAGAAAALVVAVRSLDQPWLKRRIQALVRSNSGLDLDYRATHVGAAGLRIEDLVILSPPSLRVCAPELARVGEIEARWSVTSLTRSDGPKLQVLSLRGVALTLVGDARRGSSLDIATSPAPSPPKPATPLSRQVATLLEKPPLVGRVELQGARLTLIRAADGRVEERVDLSGLGALLAFDQESSGSWRLSAAIGSEKAPLELALERAGRGRARLSLALEAAATASSAKAFVDLRALEQTLVPVLSMERLLRLEATARFDPAAGRTELTLASLQAADDSVRAKAALVIPDRGGPLLSEAEGEIDAVRALSHVPEGLLPIDIEGGHVSFRVRALELASAPRLGPAGEAHLEASTRRLKVPLNGRGIDATQVKLELDAKPKEGAALAGRAALSLDKLLLAEGPRRVEADRIEATLDALAASDGTWNGQAGVRLAALAASVGPSISAAQAHLGLRIRGLSLAPTAPLGTRGEVQLTAGASSLAVDAAPWRVRATDLGLEGGTRLAGAAPSSIDLDLPVRALQLSGPGGRALSSTPLQLHLHAAEVSPDPSRPLRTRGKAKLGLELGALRASLDLMKQADAVDYTLLANAASLAAAQSLLPEAERWKLPWERLALSLQSSGRVERLTSPAPKLTERSELQIDKPGLTLAAGAGSAERLALTLRSEGDLARHHAGAELSVHKLALDGEPHGDVRLSLSAQIDAAARSLRFELNGAGDSGPSGEARIAADFDPRAKKLSYDVAARLGRLAPFAPFLKGIDVARLETAIAARGWLAGVVDEVGADGALMLAPHPLATLGAEGTFDVLLKGFGWNGGDQAIAVPVARLQGELEAAEGHSVLRGDLKVDSARFVLGERALEFADVNDHWELQSADLAAGEVELDQRVRVGSARQSFAAGYPVGELSIAIKASRDRDGTVRAPLVQVDNPAAGTSLMMSGRAEAGALRRAVSLRAELHQDLARAWSERERFEGRGSLGVRLRVSSADLRTFHTRASARFTGADLRLPKAGWAVESLDAEIPAEASVIFGAGGPALRFESGNSPFAQPSYKDQQPLQERRTFLSIARLTTPAGVVAPVAGNLEVSRGAVLLSQLELGVRKGLVAGQCELLFQGQEPTLIARVRASGVESSRGEPFDGNIAVSVSTRERRVEGRAEILRIGRRHLLDLLDIQDPYRADPSLNRIRTALALGYPEHVRLTFRQGFANLDVAFGGLARLLRVEEVRGIPVGPLLDKALAPLSKEKRP